MKENRYRLGAAMVHPYRFYFGTVGLFDRIEVNGRVTQVIGVPGFDNNNSYGDFKDKAVDAKFQFLKEGKYLPALAIVVSDPTGTRLYASQAIVASKQTLPLRLLVRLRQRPPRQTAPPPAGGRVQGRTVQQPRAVGPRGPPLRGRPVRPYRLAVLDGRIQPDPVRTANAGPRATEIFHERRPLPPQLRRARQTSPMARGGRELAAGK